jgi:outer membrane protein assembly factor BamB
MRQLLQTWYASSWGDDALSWLAEDAWARGDLDQARLYWTQLVSVDSSSPGAPLVLRYPDTGIPRSSILARLVLCSIMQGDDVAAGSELRAFRDLYPAEEGRLAGREGVLHEILEEVVVEARGWPADRTVAGCPTFACHPDRNGAAASLSPVLRPLWKASLANAEVSRMDGPRTRREAGTYPVVWKGIVVVQDASGIRALSLTDGQPAWPSGRPNDRGMIYRAADANSIEFPPIGIARYSGTMADGHYFTRVGPPVFAPVAGSLRQAEDRLIALDLGTGEGRLRWDVTTDELLDEEGWRFTGAPMAAAGRLFVTMRRAVVQVEVAVGCLDADTGKLIWRQPVAVDLESPAESRHRLDHELLTFATGTLFFANQAGLVVALDADSGRLRWVASYPSWPLSPAELSHPAHAGLLPPLFDRGTLYLAPRDASHVMAIDAGTGVLRWQTRKPGRISGLLGVTQNMLVADGDQLWRIAADTGRLYPPFGYDDPAGYGFGRGAIAGSSVYWTTRDELFEVDLVSGRALRRAPLEMLGGGNLVIADDCLLLAEPHQLTVFSAR